MKHCLLNAFSCLEVVSTGVSLIVLFLNTQDSKFCGRGSHSCIVVDIIVQGGGGEKEKKR